MLQRFLSLMLALVCLAGVTPALAASSVATQFHNGLAWFGEVGNMGYIDTKGNVVIEPQFYQAFDFNGYGQAMVSVTRKHKVMGSFASFQLIDTTGKVLLKTPGDKNNQIFTAKEWQGEFGITEAEKVGKHPKWGWTGLIGSNGYYLVNQKNKLINKKPYTYLSPFSNDGFAVAGTGLKNKKAEYKSSSSSSSTAAINRTYHLGEYKGNTLEYASTSYFHIDQTGKQLGKATYKVVPGNFSEGLAAVPGKKPNARGEYTWGYIDVKGKEVIPSQYASAGNFSGGLAKVSRGGKYGYINTAGEEVIALKWDAIGNFFVDGITWMKKGDLYGYINQHGQVVSEPQWESASDLNGGLARVKKDGKYGYLDASGALIIPCRYDEAYSFYDGYACVKDGLCWTAIDPQGQAVIPVAYESLTNLRSGLFAGTTYTAPVIVNEKGDMITVLLQNGNLPEAGTMEGETVKLLTMPEMENGLSGKMFVGENGEHLSMIMYSDIEGESFHITTGSGKLKAISAQHGVFEGDYDEITASKTSQGAIFKVKKDNKFGYVNHTGEVISDPQYDKAGPYADDAAIVWKGNKWHILDLNGNVVF